MSSKGRQIAKNIGKSIKKKFEADFFQFPFGLEEQQKDLLYLPTPPFNTSPQGSPPLSGRKRAKMQSPKSPKKSSSLGTIAATETANSGVVDHDEIISLTHDVKKFSDSLARLKLLFTGGIDSDEDARVIIHEGLGEVLSVLNPVMQHYPALQSPDIFTAARGLITLIKDHDYEEELTQANTIMFCDAIDQLALAFSSSVSEYLMGDMGPQLVMDFKTKSMNNIAEADSEVQSEETEPSQTTPEELDALLVGLDSGLNLALQRAKVWSKYVHDIISYIEKKAQLEMDYAKNLSRLAHTVQNSLKKEGFLPLQSVYCTALSQDVEFASNLQATQSLLHAHKFVEPLTVRRTEHDKVYKFVKEHWHRELRRMSDSVTNLRKAQALYTSRQQDHERARELALKADGEKQEKRRKAEEEAMHKAAEAETTYKACVAEANHRQQELFKVKRELIAKTREQIYVCDQVIKNVTVEYFQLYNTVVSPLPLQFQTLSESCKSYDTGSQYAEYIKRLPPTNRTVQPEVFTFEPYIQGQKGSPDGNRKESVHSNGSVSDHAHSPEGSPVASPRRDKYRIPVKAWGQSGHHGANSDTDSASCSSKSHESSPSGSPQGVGRRHLVTSQSLDELTEEEIIAAAAAAYNGQDKRSLMKRMMTVGGDDTLDLPNLLMHHRGRRNTTFGVDFQEQVDIFQTKVPPIISKCLTEIEKRGVMIKSGADSQGGIYRVSGVKSKVEHLCQRFDIDPEAVSLEDVHPNIISNVLKLYLRQLPEPLLTFRLYSDFIHTAKENMSGQLAGDHLIDHLKFLVKRLPSSNLRTCAVLMHHLQRVASHSELNQMSASNLGIVFGPTLLRPLEGSASLASLVDTPHQTRAIELLITHAHIIFGPSEDFQVAPSQTPIEQLDRALSNIILPAQARTAEVSPSSSSAAKARSSTASVEPDDLSLPVFESSSSASTGPSATQPSASEYVLPGTASLQRQDSLSLSLNDLGLDEPEAGSDEEEPPDLPLPDQSKPQSEPLSAVLTPRCIQVTEPRAGEAPAQPPAPRSAVTKSASSPVVSRSTRTSLPSSVSVPASMSGPEVVAALNVSQRDSGHGLATSASTGAFSVSGELGVPKSPKAERLSKSSQDSGSYSTDLDGAEKPSGEDGVKKKPHSQQLENIKFLTKAPSVDTSSPGMDDFSLKAAAAGAQSSGSTSSAGGGSNRGSHSPRLPSGAQEVAGPSSAGPATKDRAGESTATEASPSVLRSAPSQSKGAALRKSILEEMPIPTLSTPRSPTIAEGSDAVTIPASPTIKRRELPSKIPTSPSAGRSADAKKDVDKGDSRADRFKQEQRKLLSAIKSDSLGTGTGKTSSRPSSSSSVPEGEDCAKTAATDEGKRSSGVFDDVVSGGCALSSSRRTGSQSSASSDTVSKDAKPALAAASGAVAPSGAVCTEGGSESSGKSSPSSKPKVDAAKRSPSGGGADSPKADKSSAGSGRPYLNTPAQTSPRQRGTQAAGSSSPPKPALALGRARPLAMPSTTFTRKPASSASPSSVSTAKQSPSSRITRPVSSPSAGGPKKVGQSSDQSPQVSSRSPAVSGLAIATGKTGAETTTKSSSPTLKTSTRIGETSTKSAKPGPEGVASSKSSVTAKVERSPSSSSLSTPSGSAGSRLRNRSGETTGVTSKMAKPVQRKSSSGGSGSASSSPRKVHERYVDKAGSPIGSGKLRGTATTPVSKAASSTRPTVLPTANTTPSSSSSSPATTPTSGTGKLSADRTPRFV